MSENRNNIQPKQEKEPVIRKKIGKGTYEVTVHFSKTSNETINDKLLRIMKNDIVSKNH